MSAFWAQVCSAARLTEARPKAKTNTIEIIFFILLPFQKLFIFTADNVRNFSALALS
jgi:hypothetical protein